MEYFAVLPIRKYLDKPIAINDSGGEQIGFVQRKYKSFWDKLINYLPLSFLETRNLNGEINNYHLRIRERSFKSNLFRLKWNVYVKENGKEKTFLLEDKTKISTNPRVLYHKNNKEYIFKKDIFNRICEVYINDCNIACAKVRMDKRVPPSVKVKIENNDLTVIELLAIYYIMNLIY